MAGGQDFDPGRQMRLFQASMPSFVRRLYAGPAGAVLRILSYLSMHVPLSELWLRHRVFDLRGVKRVLDAGCGAGQLTGHLAKYADSDASITACDLSVEMLLRARQRLANPAIQFVPGDITQLPFPDASFDCVTCGYAIEHLSDVQPGLTELARVLRVSGRLLLLTTEDRWSGHVTARLWNCRTCNREALFHLSRRRSQRQADNGLARVTGSYRT